MTKDSKRRSCGFPCDSIPSFGLGRFRGGDQDTSSDDNASAQDTSVSGVSSLPTTDVSEATSVHDADALTAADESSNKTTINVTELVFGVSKPGDGSENDPDGIPERFLRMHKGNRQHAKDAFIATVQWRLENEVDTILSRAHPIYDLCKKIFPHYFAGHDPNGNPIVVQRPGCIDFDLARKLQVSMDDLLLHYVYILEYCWNILEPGPDAVMTSVIDMKNVGLRQCLHAEMRDFIQKSVGVISENYPQRSHRTLVINAPGWFGRLFKILKPLLRESTRAKIAIYNKGPEQDKALAEILGEAALPAELLVDPSVLKRQEESEFEPGPKSQLEHDLRQFVLAIMDVRNEEMKVV